MNVVTHSVGGSHLLSLETRDEPVLADSQLWYGHFVNNIANANHLRMVRHDNGGFPVQKRLQSRSSNKLLDIWSNTHKTSYKMTRSASRQGQNLGITSARETGKDLIGVLLGPPQTYCDIKKNPIVSLTQQECFQMTVHCDVPIVAVRDPISTYCGIVESY